MGCNQSSGHIDIKESNSSQNGHGQNKFHKEAENEKMDMNSNRKISDSGDGKVAGTDEADALDRFKGQLMNQLMSIANAPPLVPLQPVEGDPRQILVPSVFRCADTLAELKTTSIPAESNLLVTYLKSGTHWLWEIMKMLRKGEAIVDGIPKEMGHLEFFPPSTLKDINGKDLTVFATHFPLWTLPTSCYSNHKLVYAIRNPKDVCVSLFFHFVNMSEANPKDFPAIPFDQFFEMFLAPSESNMMGNWFDHVADFWDNYRSDPNILCVMFEDMKKDPMKETRRINEHLGTKASDGLLQQIVDATTFSSLSESKKSSEKHLEIIFKGSMYRKGQVGDWKNYMSEEQSRRMDEKMEQWQSERSERVPLVYEL